MKNLLIKLSLCSVLVICCFHTTAQVDSTYKAKADSLQKVLQAEKEDTNKVNTLNALGTTLLQQNDTTDVLRYEEQALPLAEKLDFKRGIGKAYVNISNTNYRQQNFTEALKNIQLALQAYLQTGDKSNIAYCFYYIGEIYSRGASKK